MSTHQKATLDAAMDYAARGWSVIPIKYREKKSSVNWKIYQSTRAAESTIRKWFASDANLGIVCGDISGDFVVRDFDDADSYDSWKSQNPELSGKLPTVKTRRGYHVYARMSPCPRLMELADGELRATGGYVMAPPSIHPERMLYRWIVPLPSGDLPLVDPVIFGVSPVGQKTDRRRTEVDGCRPTQTEADRITEAVEGKVSICDFDAIISRSIPTGPGKRNRALLDLARRILFVTGGQALSIDSHFAIFEKWWELSAPIIETQDKAISLDDFMRATEKAHTPLNEAIYIAFEAAKTNDNPKWAQSLGDPVAFLAGICRELQRFHGDNVFFLSCRTAGDLIGVDYRVANKYLNLFQRLEKIKEVQKGTPCGNVASRYRYIADDL